MAFARFAVVSEPVSAEALALALERELRAVGEGCGALATFLGVVRATHRGTPVQRLEYEAYAPLAEKVFALIGDEASALWPASRLAVHHRVGRLAIGEASVAIAAGAAHRAESFQVCRYAIERVKQVAPVWKHEFYENGAEWIEGATADPGDVAARERARAVACA
jgi:molybdopterin synthase catalytic subunit